MFIQELKWIKSHESRLHVWSSQTQSREPGHKSLEEKVMWPYTSKFNPYAKNHSLHADDRVKDTLRSRPSLLSHINHAGAFLIFILLISLLLRILRGNLFFDISLTLTKAAVSFATLLCWRNKVWRPAGERWKVKRSLSFFYSKVILLPLLPNGSSAQK